MAYLVWNSSKGGQVHDLQSKTRIGRSSENTIVLSDAHASQLHARVTRRLDRWVYEDLESTNGSTINGSPQSKAALSDGDVIRIGRTTLSFRETLDDRRAGESDSGVFARGEHSRATTMIGERFPDDPNIARVSAISSDGGAFEAPGDPGRTGELVGGIEVDSEEGKGTIFSMFLPARRPAGLEQGV